MKTSQKGIDLIKHYEGYSSEAYVCPAGYKTIGYGHLVRSWENLETLTKDQAEDILKKDLRTSEKAVLRLTKVSLSQSQFDALVSFVFNLGAGAYQASTLRRVINRGETQKAPQQLRRWVYAGGRKLKGLIRRREAEVYLWEEA